MKNIQSSVLAKELFAGDYNCSQSVLKALAETSGMDNIQAEAIAAGFGGGMGRHQEICGAVSGACMAISHAVFNMYSEKIEGKEAAYNAVQQFMNKFKDEKTHVRCIDLTQHDFMIESEREKFSEAGLKDKICVPAVEFAVALASEIIAENAQLNKK